MKHKEVRKGFRRIAFMALAFMLAVSAFFAVDLKPSDAATQAGTPAITSAYSTGYDSVKLIWSAATGAASYELYKATSSTGTYYKVGDVTGTSRTVNGLTSGKTYYFKVRAVTSTGVRGLFSKVATATPRPSKPSITASSVSYTQIKVSWQAIAGATGYNVYRATSANGTYSYIGTTTKTSYTNGYRTTGKTYYYKVKAYRTVGSSKVYSYYSTYKSAKAVPAAPASIGAATKTMSKAKVTWSAVTGATKYQVYRATSADGTYSLAGTVSSSTRYFIDASRTTGKTYYYKVRAYHLEGTTKVYGKFTSVKSVKVGAVYPIGTYKIGTDIPVGEYYLVGSSEFSMYFTSTDLAGNYVKTEGYPDPNLYATLPASGYVTFDEVKVYSMKYGNPPLAPKDLNGNLLSGEFKVGRDINPGTYVLYGVDYEGDSFAFVDIFKDSLNSYYSEIGFNYASGGRIYVTVESGQYLQFYGSIGYPVANVQPWDISSGSVSDGMYLVGYDIPAGTYTVIPEDPEWGGYYEIYKDAKHSDASYIDYDDFYENTTVTVTDGQYLMLYDCTLYLI